MARKHLFRTKRADTRYQGVYYRPSANHTNPYVAWVYHNGRAIQIGYFHDDLDAALAADLARYLIWGPCSKTWYSGERRRRVNPPNYSPTKLPFNPQAISKKLHRLGVLPQETLDRNLSAYIQVANWLSGGCV